jgi:hypothetical protein
LPTRNTRRSFRSPRTRPPPGGAPPVPGPPNSAHKHEAGHRRCVPPISPPGEGRFPRSAMWRRRRRAGRGGAGPGDGRVSPSVRPWGGLVSLWRPLSVHRRPTPGATHSPVSSSRVKAGGFTSDQSRFTASPGRGAAKYITARKGRGSGPLRFSAATASNSFRVRAGLGTGRSSTTLSAFGGVHLTAPRDCGGNPPDQPPDDGVPQRNPGNATGSACPSPPTRPPDFHRRSRAARWSPRPVSSGRGRITQPLDGQSVVFQPCQRLFDLPEKEPLVVLSRHKATREGAAAAFRLMPGDLTRYGAPVFPRSERSRCELVSPSKGPYSAS